MPTASQVYFPTCLLDLVPTHPKHTKVPLLLLSTDDFPEETQGDDAHTTGMHPHNTGIAWQGPGGWELHPD